MLSHSYFVADRPYQHVYNPDLLYTVAWYHMVLACLAMPRLHVADLKKMGKSSIKHRLRHLLSVKLSLRQESLRSELHTAT